MERLRYPVEYAASVLGVTTTTVQELKRKLKIGKYITHDDLQRLKEVVKDIRKSNKNGMVSLTTINQFMRYNDISKY